MNGPLEDDCECDFFGEGEWVECKLDTNQFGIVVSSSDWGRYTTVMLAGTVEPKIFYSVTLRHMGDGDDVLPPLDTAEADDTNVIDFTKARDLRKNTTTRGAA